jgi:hypothetical protein
MHDYIIIITRTKQHTKWHTILQINLLTTCMTIAFLLLEKNSTKRGTLHLPCSPFAMPPGQRTHFAQTNTQIHTPYRTSENQLDRHTQQGITWNYTNPYGSTWKHMFLIRPWNNMEPFWSEWNHMELHGNTQNHIEPHGRKWNNMELHWTVWWRQGRLEFKWNKQNHMDNMKPNKTPGNHM